MIISTFLFNDEFDMLSIFLEISNSYVDKWIILEGNKTFSGKHKKYNLKNNLHQFEKFKNKIILMNLEIPDGYKDWNCDNYSRISMQKEINKFHDNDIIIHGDVDEVLNPLEIPNIIEMMDKNDKPVALTIDMFIYKFDQRVMRKWKGPVLSRKRMFQNPQQLIKGDQQKRKNRNHCVHYDKPAGWHWTWIGNDERIKNKVESCIESKTRDPNQVLEAFKRLDAASAINHKCATTYDPNPQYPAVVLEVIKKYPYWTKLKKN
jgi:beta-1,4-mannosyl-glycoprotein beta-1,4-N-acetylglucosaminyltransferase